MYGDGFFHGWGAMWLGPLFMFGLPLLILVLIVWWLMDTRRTNGSATPRRDARALLDERLARGEIDEEEYRRRRDAIES